MHVSLLDKRKLYFELLAFKRSKRWSNLLISPEVVETLLDDSGWYRLFAPEAAVALGDLSNISLWHDMAISLMRKYCEMFYGLRRKQWEADKLEYRPITENTQYLPGVREDTPDGAYLFTLDHVRHESLITQLGNLRAQVAAGDTSSWQSSVVGGLEFIWSEKHFYQPLLAAVQGRDFQVVPVPLNKGERDFVKDLQEAYRASIFNGYDIYLLRNHSGQGAVGVFIDGGFQPDFILWMVQGNRQKIVFIDPKGLKYHKPDDPKIQFHKTIKEMEHELKSQNGTGIDLELHAFLVSETSSAILCGQWKMPNGDAVTVEDMEDWNILFPEQTATVYLKKLVGKVEA